MEIEFISVEGIYGSLICIVYDQFSIAKAYNISAWAVTEIDSNYVKSPQDIPVNDIRTNKKPVIADWHQDLVQM